MSAGLPGFGLGGVVPPDEGLDDLPWDDVAPPPPELLLVAPVPALVGAGLFPLSGAAGAVVSAGWAVAVASAPAV
jgi:hypothetical protein